MELKVGYKQTEIGVIPAEWQTEILERVCVRGGLVRGPFGGALKKEFFVKHGFKVYEQRNAIHRDANLGSYFIDDNKYHELRRFHVKEGDFIISCSGTIGRIFQIPKGAEAGVINQALLKTRTDCHVIHDRFFFYVFDWHEFQQKIIDNTQGGAMQNLVGMGIIRNISVPLPPLPEQQAIAAALSDVDALSSALDKLIAKKRDIKAAATQQLLTGKTRLPGFSGEWDTASIEQLEKSGLLKLSRGKVISAKDIEKNAGEYPIYSSSVKNSGLFGRYGVYMFDEELITWSVDGGGDFFYRPKHRFSVTNVCGFMRVDTSKIDYRFLAAQLEVHHGRLAFDYLIKAHPSVIRKAYVLSIPSLPEQRAVAAIVSDMDAEIAALERRRDKTRALKQGMMQELLTGRTRLI